MFGRWAPNYGKPCQNLRLGKVEWCRKRWSCQVKSHLSWQRNRGVMCVTNIEINSLRLSDTYMSVNWATIVSDNGLLPGQCQPIIWTNAGLLLIGPLGTNFNEISIDIHIFSIKKIHLKMLSAKWHSFCLGLNVSTLQVPFWQPSVQPMMKMSSKWQHFT